MCVRYVRDARVYVMLCAYVRAYARYATFGCLYVCMCVCMYVMWVCYVMCVCYSVYVCMDVCRSDLMYVCLYV